MWNPFNRENRERGATLVEYGVAMALIVAVSVPAMGAATTAMSTGMNDSVSHFAHTDQNLGPSGGTASTVPVPVPVAVTIPFQEVTKEVMRVHGVDVNISVTFRETNGVVSVQSIVPDGWRYEIVEQVNRRMNICFYHPDSNRELRVNVRIRGDNGELYSWINRWRHGNNRCP